MKKILVVALGIFIVGMSFEVCAMSTEEPYADEKFIEEEYEPALHNFRETRVITHNDLINLYDKAVAAQKVFLEEQIGINEIMFRRLDRFQGMVLAIRHAAVLAMDTGTDALTTEALEGIMRQLSKERAETHDQERIANYEGKSAVYADLYTILNPR